MRSRFNDRYTVSEIKISYKSKQDLEDRPRVLHMEDAYPILRSAWDDSKIDCVEESKVLLLNRNNRVLGIYEHSTGGISATIVDARLVFPTALKANASSMIIAHNHPSGSLIPSTADRQLTTRFNEIGRLLDIDMLDHLIITRNGCRSIVGGEEFSLSPSYG